MTNLFNALLSRLTLLGDALAALLHLAPRALACVSAPGGTLKERLAAQFTKPEMQRDVFALLRAFRPNLLVNHKLITSYDNIGTLVVTRHADVMEVLDRESDFETVYEPRMRMLTDGSNFFLGMQDVPDYTRDLANMRLVVRRDDLPSIIVPFCARRAGEIVAASAGRLDVPAQLTQIIPAQLLDVYFGTPGPSQAAIIEWASQLFHYIFLDLSADPKVAAEAEKNAGHLRAYLDRAIAVRKASREHKDDVLGRCLALQWAGSPGMDDHGIRNNLLGLVIAAVPTLSKSSVQALCQLLERPDALAKAQAAARANDDAALAACICEALRFDPLNPVIYRRALRDCTIAAHTLRARNVPKSTMVYAANFSAMFDPVRIPHPNQFRTDRAASEYILWGYGRHTCFGAYINAAALPAMLKPLLAQRGLRRAPGKDGQVDMAGTPFPQHFVVEFDV